MGDVGGLANVGEVERTYTDGSAQVEELIKGPGENAATAAALRGIDAAVAVQLPRRGKSAAHYLSPSTALWKAQMKLGECSLQLNTSLRTRKSSIKISTICRTCP